MLRYLLVFLVGALLGANVAWYYATSRGATPTGTGRPATAPVGPPTPTVKGPVPDGGPPQRGAAPARAPAPGATGLIVPVQGIRADQLTDTYTQSRAGGRLHEAIDIMAPAGTPVLAAVDGPVAKLFTSERGGLTVYQFDVPGRRVYYYAHLQGYAPGLAEGQMLRQGQVIGYVGSTGSASPEAPHLHFGVGELTPEKRWSNSVALNPYPLLVGAPAR